MPDQDSAASNERIFGRCRTCNGLGVYFDKKLRPTSILTAQFIQVIRSTSLETPQLRSKVQVLDNPPAKLSPPRVTQRITDAGYYYQLGGREFGLFTANDERDPAFDLNLAKKFGMDPKDLLLTRAWEIQRPTTFSELADVLGCTIRQDEANKLILLCAGVLTFTEEDQVNILMSGESAGGKSYTALEVASYLPSNIVRIIATASPTAFFHDQGTWDNERHILIVDLKQKVLIFLDQPHYTLMERMRPLLSHDRPELLYKITDKNKRGSLRTKNVLIQGFPTVVFCAAKLSLDEQERTRVFILSPETSQEKLDETIRLKIARDGDREAFKAWLETHPRRRWLRARIEAIQKAAVNQVILPDEEPIYERFRKSHSHLAPRHQRDISRILALIKAHALLNCWHRESPRRGTIEANAEDVEAGFWLYGLIAKSNELGLAPQLYEIWDSVIRPLVENSEIGVQYRTIIGEYHHIYGRYLSYEKLRREILPALEACGLIVQEPDPEDRRRRLVSQPIIEGGPPNPPLISSPVTPETIGGTSGGHPFTHQGEFRLISPIKGGSG